MHIISTDRRINMSEARKKREDIFEDQWAKDHGTN